MATLPNYFNHFVGIYPEEVIEMYTSIENSFAALNYEAHQDDVDFVFEDTGDLTSKDITNMIDSIYREHLNTVLSMQGIFLTNPFADKLFPLVKILGVVVLLATQPPHELFASTTIDLNNSEEIQFAHILSVLSDLSITDSLLHVERVIPEVIQYLTEDKPIMPIIKETQAMAETRFKNSNLPMKGVVVDTIKAINHFGYNLDSFLVAHAEIISDIREEELTGKSTIESLQLIANEIILMVLGSSTPNNVLYITMSEVTEHILDNLADIIRVTGLIDAYRENKND